MQKDQKKTLCIHVHALHHLTGASARFQKLKKLSPDDPRCESGKSSGALGEWRGKNKTLKGKCKMILFFVSKRPSPNSAVVLPRIEIKSFQGKGEVTIKN